VFTYAITVRIHFDGFGEFGNVTFAPVLKHATMAHLAEYDGTE